MTIPRANKPNVKTETNDINGIASRSTAVRTCFHGHTKSIISIILLQTVTYLYVDSSIGRHVYEGWLVTKR